MRRESAQRTSSKWGCVNPFADTRSTAVEWDPYPFFEEWQSKEFTVPTVLVIIAHEAHAISSEGPVLTCDDLLEALRSRCSATDVHLSTTKLRSEFLPSYRGSSRRFESLLHQTMSTTIIEEQFVDRALLDFSKGLSALSRRLERTRPFRREPTPSVPRTKGLPLLGKIRAATADVPREEWSRVPKDLSLNFEEYVYGRSEKAR